MKKLCIACTLLLLLNACSKDKTPAPPPSPVDTLASGWTKTTLPDTSFLIDIFFYDSNNGYAINEHNIYRTSNAGTTWTNVFHTNHAFLNMSMPSLNNAAFICPFNSPLSNTSKVFFTTNGGNSFDSVVINDFYCNDIFFVNASTGFISGRYLWKTTDAGYHWNAVADLGKTSNLYKPLFFLDEQTGWFGLEALYKTTDAGLHWTSQAIPGLNGGALNSIYFVNANKGFITDTTGISTTANGGLTWTKIYTPRSNAFHDLHFFTETTGYMTDGKTVVKTTDGGYTWNKEVILVKEKLVELHFTDVNHGWACAEHGTILRYLK